MNFIQNAQAAFNQDFTQASLKLMIILVALLFMVLALTVQNKWLLAGILAYIVLP